MKLVCVWSRWIAVCLFVGRFGFINSSFGDESAEKMLEFLRHGYLDNREKLREFDSTFTVTEGSVELIEEALQGNPTKVTRIRNGIWVVKSGAERYELLCADREDEQLPAISKSKVKWVGSLCNSHKFLSNSELKLFYSKDLMLANLSPTRLNSPGINITPIAMGIMGDDESRNPGSVEFPTLSGKSFRRYEGQTTVDGKSLHVISIGEEGSAGEGWKQKWLLDPAQGFLPVEILYYSPTPTLSNRVIVTKVRRCQNGACIAERSVNMRFPESKGPFGVSVIQLTRFDEGKPIDDRFAVELPTGTRILNPADTSAFIKLAGDKRINAADLSGWYRQCNEASRARKQPTPLAERRSVMPYIVAANVIALIVIAAIIYRRCRPRP